MRQNFDSVSPATQATTCPNKPIYEIVVDPDRAHLGESFVIDMRKITPNKPKENNLNEMEKNAIADNLMRFASSTSTRQNAATPKKVGRAIPNIQDVDYSHPANPVPSTVAPPQVKVFFDMPGLGSISFKYHKVLTLRNQVVFVTDKRFGGSAEFYPYCNMRSGEQKKPVGVYVEGEKNLLLLDPSIKGFPIKFDCEPYEICIVPIAGAKALDSAMMQELGIVNLENGETSYGKEGSDTGGDNSSQQSGPDSRPEDVYESVEGGVGGVI